MVQLILPPLQNVDEEAVSLTNDLLPEGSQVMLCEASNFLTEQVPIMCNLSGCFRMGSTGTNWQAWILMPSLINCAMGQIGWMMAACVCSSSDNICW